MITIIYRDLNLEVHEYYFGHPIYSHINTIIELIHISSKLISEDEYLQDSIFISIKIEYVCSL